jgi:SAM-dependent methyltransferase
MSDIIRVREELRKLASEMKAGDNHLLPISFFGDCGLVSRQLVEEYGFNVYDYIGNDLGLNICFEKSKRQERWEYLDEYLRDIPKEWKCIDIGCGRNPWPRAKQLLDVYQEFAGFKLQHQYFEKGTITEPTGFRDKEFDFSYCTHVLEHVNNPEAAAREISRISKRGIVEVPTAWKDGLLNFQEQDHKWLCVKGTGEYHIYFHKIDPQQWDKLNDPDVKGAVWRTYISNTDSNGDRAILRNYFERVEKDLNIIVKWEGELKVKIFE